MESTDSSSGSQQQPQLPPGFRFHPTDEELVVHYLRKKAADVNLPASIIAEVDLYKFDPWELPAKAIFGEQEWYFFSPRDRKYPNGARPNRAATSGYWKATGTDKPVLTAGGTQKVGVKKALVFYGGKPPKGIKTSWIMHEYRLADNKPASKPPVSDFINKKNSLRLDDWVLCRIYKKNTAQRPVDLEGSDINDVIGSINMPTALTFSIGQQHQQQHQHQHQHKLEQLENEQSMYEISMMNHAMSSGSKNSSGQINNLNLMDHNVMLPTKPTVHSNMYWNNDPRNPTSTKMFMSTESNCVARNEDQYHTTASNIMSHLGPHQTPSLSLQQQQQEHEEEEAMMGSMGDGGFEQQQPYQMTNWYT